MIARKRWQAGRPSGQALVEFALILIILLFIIFILVEAGRLLFAYATLQHAVRSGARYGITGQFDDGLPLSSTEDPRVQSIKNRVLSNANGLHIEPAASPDEAYYFEVEVWGADGTGGALIEDFAGIARWPLRVRAYYRLPMITPLTRPIAQSVLLTGEVVMNNEAFDQVAGARLSGAVSAPPIPDRNEADLSVQLTEEHGGAEFYLIEITNHGPLVATGVEVEVRIEPDATATFTEYPEEACTREEQLLQCSYGPILNGHTHSLTVRIQPNDIESISIIVEVSGDQHDPNRDNNIAPR